MENSKTTQNSMEKNSKASENWKKFLEFIKPRMSITAFTNWIEPVEVVEDECGIPEFQVANLFVREYIVSNFSEPLEKIFEIDFNSNQGYRFKLMQLSNTANIDPFNYDDSKSLIENFVYETPKKYRKATFDLAEQTEYMKPGLIEYGRQWAFKPASIYVFGDVGRGKTFFSFCLIREALKRKTVRYPKFYSCVDLDSLLLEAIKSNWGDQELINKIKESEILYLDDFGRETKSERVTRQFYDIINHRYANELTTIISSNFTLDEIANTMDPALSSRIQEWDLVQLTGEDIRKKL